ncbi:unnamed protein product [Pleuronectes platessa]|uniref:Uncharacterized protein n=1 Tax=Pleuronectes platessa TaxID=8262 RepID=A0A9N7YAT5_PLEPL|nr:unnamed protein product [Pleuronectes platessa]
MQIKTQKELKEKGAAKTTSGELQGRNRRLERKKEKLQDPTNQGKSTMSKHTENQATLKEDRASKGTNEAPSATKQTKQKSVDKSVKGPKKKVEEQEEPVQAVRGRRKPPPPPPPAAQATAPAPKNQIKVKTAEAQSALQPAAPSRSRRKAAAAPPGAGEEAQNAGPRRSKRIASKS